MAELNDTKVSLKISHNNFEDFKDKHNRSMGDNTEQQANLRCKIDDISYKLKLTEDELSSTKEQLRTLEHRHQ